MELHTARSHEKNDGGKEKENCVGYRAVTRHIPGITSVADLFSLPTNPGKKNSPNDAFAIERRKFVS